VFGALDVGGVVVDGGGVVGVALGALGGADEAGGVAGVAVAVAVSEPAAGAGC
jgi:hypothetical protein